MTTATDPPHPRLRLRRRDRRSLAGGRASPRRPRLAAYPAILKPTPADQFVDFGTNAEMRWDSVDPRQLPHRPVPAVRPQPHGRRRPSTRRPGGCGSSATGWHAAHRRRRPVTVLRRPAGAAAHDGRVRRTSAPATGAASSRPSRGRPVSGTAWKLGAVGTVVWEGVRLRDVLKRVGISPATPSRSRRPGWTRATRPAASTTGRSAGRSRSARRSTTRSWPGARTASRCCPTTATRSGWSCRAGSASRSIKWLGSLEVAATELTSPWNTKWYRLTGGSLPGRLAAADGEPGPLGLGAARGARRCPRRQVDAHRPLLERRGPDPARRGQPRRRRHLEAGRARGRQAAARPGACAATAGRSGRSGRSSSAGSHPAPRPGHRPRRSHPAARRRRSTTTGTSSTRS